MSEMTVPEAVVIAKKVRRKFLRGKMLSPTEQALMCLFLGYKGKMVKEMEYKKELGFVEVLIKGRYKGFKWFILSMGTHPCAFVVLPKGHKHNGTDMEELSAPVHSGLTYSEARHNRNPFGNVEGEWVIGWDYGHYGDYFICFPKGKKWTVAEIKQEVMDCISWLEEMKNEV